MNEVEEEVYQVVVDEAAFPTGVVGASRSKTPLLRRARALLQAAAAWPRGRHVVGCDRSGRRRTLRHVWEHCFILTSGTPSPLLLYSNAIIYCVAFGSDLQVAHRSVVPMPSC